VRNRETDDRHYNGLVVAVLLATLAGCGAIAPDRGPAAGRAREEGSPWTLRRAPTLQRLVDPQPMSGDLMWLGGDVAASVSLTRDRYIWLFGDTLLGTVSDECPRGVRYCDRDVDDDPSRGMIANSIGVMRPRDGGAPIVKFWRTIDGEPAPIFAAAEPDEFLWPLAAVRVRDQLLVAASRHSFESGLHSLGSVFLRVENPDSPPDAWTYTRHPAPNVIAYPVDTEPLSWSTALVGADSFVYVFGARGLGFDARTVVARLEVDDVIAPDWTPAPEYLLESSEGQELTWSAVFEAGRLHELEGLPGTSEAAVMLDDELGWYTVYIPPFASEVRLYTAPHLLGPWRDRGVVYRIPAPWSTTRLENCPPARPDCGELAFGAYAAKPHPELAPARGHVVSYNVNMTMGMEQSSGMAAERVHGFYVPQMLMHRGEGSHRAARPTGRRGHRRRLVR
jgi:hypothetical protein